MNRVANGGRQRDPLIWLGITALAFLLVAPYVIPLILDEFWVTVLAEIFIWSLFAASVNLLLGYTGLLSFGQAVYFGMAAYGVALGFDLLGLSFWPAFLFGTFVAILTAALTGFFAVRLTWHYFAIITVVFSLIFYFVAVGWKDLTGGDDGLPFELTSVFKMGETELALSDLTFQYYFMLVMVGACFFLMYRILQSPLGRALVAVRENDSRASLIGLSPYWIRYVSFVLAGGFAGIAGALFALFSRYASAYYMFWTVSGEGVIWTIVGGTRTLFGPAVGAGFLIILREELSLYWEHYLLVVGAIVILTVTFAPAGIMGLLHKLVSRAAAGRPAVEPEAKVAKQAGESLE